MTGWKAWLAVIALAVTVRAAVVFTLHSHETPRSTFEHGEIAANLLNGKGFSIAFLGANGPTSQQAPIYPSVVAVVYAIGGIETPQSLLILEFGQAVLGGVLAAGAWKLAREVAPNAIWAGSGAGLIVALHPTLVYAATHVQVALLAATLLTWAFALAYQSGRTGRIRDLATTGAVFGTLILTDPILTLAAPVLVWIIIKGRITLRRASIFALTAALVVTPWLVRNYRVHHEFVWVKSTFGYAFWQGNCALSQGTDKVVRASVEEVFRRANGGTWRSWNESLWKARHVAGYIDDIALSKLDKAILGKLSEPERSRRLFQKAVADLRKAPERYPILCLRRLRLFLLFDDTNPKTRSLIYRTGHLGLTALAALGWLFAGSESRRKMGPTAWFALFLTAFHVLTIVSARFHLPLQPLFAVWGSVGVERLARRVWFEQTGRFQPRLPTTSKASGSRACLSFDLEEARSTTSRIPKPKPAQMPQPPTIAAGMK